MNGGQQQQQHKKEILRRLRASASAALKKGRFMRQQIIKQNGGTPNMVFQVCLHVCVMLILKVMA